MRGRSVRPLAACNPERWRIEERASSLLCLRREPNVVIYRLFHTVFRRRTRQDEKIRTLRLTADLAEPVDEEFIWRGAVAIVALHREEVVVLPQLAVVAPDLDERALFVAEHLNGAFQQ